MAIGEAFEKKQCDIAQLFSTILRQINGEYLLKWKCDISKYDLLPLCVRNVTLLLFGRFPLFQRNKKPSEDIVDQGRKVAFLRFV